MPEIQEKEEKDKRSELQKPAAGDESSWSEDQKKRGYYYDDGCGYEVYQPDEEDEDAEQISR